LVTEATSAKSAEIFSSITQHRVQDFLGQGLPAGGVTPQQRYGVATCGIHHHHRWVVLLALQQRRDQPGHQPAGPHRDHGRSTAPAIGQPGPAFAVAPAGSV
jgi:hypothetical protein